MLPKIRAWSARHSVFMRTACYAAMLVCVPLMLFSFNLTANGRKDILSAWEKHSASIAASTASHFSTWAEQMFLVSQDVFAHPYLQPNFLNQSTYEDRMAVQTLQYYQSALPYASNCALYVGSLSDAIYTSEGKYETDIFLKYVLPMERDAFLALLNQPQTIAFLPWQPGAPGAVCAISMAPHTSETARRVCLFLLPRAQILQAFQTVLGENGSQIAAIFNKKGEPLFYNSSCPFSLEQIAAASQTGTLPADEKYTCFSATASSGYTIAIYVPQSVYANSASAFEASLRIIILVNTCLALAIVAVLTWLHYRPVHHLLSRMGLRSSAKQNEFEAIWEAFSSRESRMNALVRENDENRALLRGRLVEKLLDGESIRPAEAPILESAIGEKGYFFVAIAQLSAIRRPLAWEQSPQSKAGVYAFEMRRDGYIAFLCRVSAPEMRTPLVRLLHEAIRAPLSVGTMEYGWMRLYKSYLEAMLAFDKSASESIVFFEQVWNGEREPEKDRSMELMQLARALKNGDSAVLQQMDALFDDIAQHMPLFSRQRYACFQILDSLRRILAKLDVSLSSERVAQILDHNSLNGIRTACQAELTAFLRQIRENSQEQKDSLAAQMRDLAERSYADCDFGLPSLAEAFGMTEYTASRIFKEGVGEGFKKFLTGKRLTRAKELLRTSQDSVAEIAVRVGFSSDSYFIRVFKAEEGITPAAWRQAAKNEGSPSAAAEEPQSPKP